MLIGFIVTVLNNREDPGEWNWQLGRSTLGERKRETESDAELLVEAFRRCLRKLVRMLSWKERGGCGRECHWSGLPESSEGGPAGELLGRVFNQEPDGDR